MKPDKKDIRSLISISHEKFIIPYFQRAYVWNITNWESWIDTLNDLLQNTNESSTSTFIGSVILKAEKAEQEKANRFLVIDGQQRFTTAIIFLKTCKDINVEELEDMFIDYAKCTDNGKKYSAFKLENSHLDKDIFQEILEVSSPLDIQSDLDEIMPFVFGERKTRKKYNTPHRLVQAYWYLTS